ncbi:MAG: hypothetical protein ACYCT1_19755, partial [Steroidobacteraceae bacterium]
MIGRLRGSLAGRIGTALALMAVLTAALTATALRWVHSGALGLALALVVCLPVLLWLAVRAARPWRYTLAAVSGGIESLRERDFSVSIAAPLP